VDRRPGLGFPMAEVSQTYGRTATGAAAVRMVRSHPSRRGWIGCLVSLMAMSVLNLAAPQQG
jgi:hypothetical protein